MHALEQFLFHPLTIAPAAALAFALLLALQLSTARSNQRLRIKLEAAEQDAAQRLEKQQAAIEAIRVELEELKRPAFALPTGPGGGVNLTRRSQALRMHRNGESPEKIAASLGMSRSEVDLLLKVQRTLVARL
jgi:hypothetical protein